MVEARGEQLEAGWRVKVTEWASGSGRRGAALEQGVGAGGRRGGRGEGGVVCRRGEGVV